MKLFYFLLNLSILTVFLLGGKQVSANVVRVLPVSSYVGEKAWKTAPLPITPAKPKAKSITDFWQVLKNHTFTKFFFIGAIFLAATIVLLWLSKTSPTLWIAGILAGIATSAFMLLWVIEVLTRRPLW